MEEVDREGGYLDEERFVDEAVVVMRREQEEEFGFKCA